MGRVSALWISKAEEPGPKVGPSGPLTRQRARSAEREKRIQAAVRACRKRIDADTRRREKRGKRKRGRAKS